MAHPGIEERLAEVRGRIVEACRRADRDPTEVTVIAVTKGHGADAVRAALAAGIADIGENRVQELDGKVLEVGRGAARWHLIGHLQRNKVRRAIDLADLIHSVDSVRLAEKVSEEARLTGRVIDVLVQVNVSGEETKGGLEGRSVLEDLSRICELEGLRVLGLMTMAPFTDDATVQRRVFAAARSLSEEAGRTIAGFEPRHLSMGMSGDYEVAIEEGSTLVRLGTVLFGERDR